MGQLVELAEYIDERCRSRKVAVNEAVARNLVREQQLRDAARQARALSRKRRR